MAAADARRLQDVLTRHQVYLEGVKVFYARTFTRMLQELVVELRKLFSRIPYSTLDALTKAQLQGFVRQLRELQHKAYERYTQTLLEDLQEFMAVDLAVAKSLFSSLARSDQTDETDEDELLNDSDMVLETEGDENNGMLTFAVLRQTPKANERLWSTMKNTPIPASGLNLVPFIDAFTAAASGAIAAAFVKGYANKFNTNEVLASIVGTPTKNFRDGVFAKTNAQGAAVADTALQHVSSITQAAVASLFYPRYQWVSVMDSATTPICRSRNRKIFDYGKGPLPPAHVHCRSTTVPYVGKSNDPGTYAQWFKSQPQNVRDDIGDGYGGNRMLSHKSFRAKLALMLEDDDDEA